MSKQLCRHMKNVHVVVADGWSKEVWKISRRFASSLVQTESQDGDMEMTVTIHPCFSDKGLPSELIVSCSVSKEYIANMSSFGVLFTHVRALFMPPGFALQYISTLNNQFQMNGSLFRTLQMGDRWIPDLWNRSLIQYFNDIEKPLSGTLVNKIILPEVCDFQILQVCVDICCLTCGHCLSNKDLVGPCASFSEPCEKCARDLYFTISRTLEVHAHKCALVRVSSISGWTAAVEYREFRDVLLTTLADIPKTHRESKSEQKIGSALPYNGACKHYKKSFRWIQYLCCGDWYACNQCHEAKCQKECDGPSLSMKCGFCSEKQSIACTCISCGKVLAPTWSAKDRVEPKQPGRRRRKKR